MSYDRIDRFLRNNLGDDDYAEYSAALDSLCAPQRKPLTDDEIEKLREKTFSTGNPYCPVDGKSMRKAARAIEAAHGIKEKNT